MQEKNYLKDIEDIKSMMYKSSRFISLSGLSGILAGIYALTGAVFIYMLHGQQQNLVFTDLGDSYHSILMILGCVAICSVATAIVLTTRKAKFNNEPIWDTASKRLVINFLIPLTTGGAYIVITMIQRYYTHTAALMLIFYGLALISASKHSIGNIKYLGYTEIIIGLVCTLFPNYSLWLWALGFGIAHILYGTWMYFRYDNIKKL